MSDEVAALDPIKPIEPIKPEQYEHEIIARTLKAFHDASPFVDQAVNPLVELMLRDALKNSYRRGFRDGRGFRDAVL